MVGAVGCRLCLSEACFKDISSEYFYNGQKEKLADILWETFNIEISYLESCSRLICEECVVKLREAANFKKQIQHVEEIITKKIITSGQVDVDTKSAVEQDDFIDHINGEFEDSNDYDDGDDDERWGSDGFQRESEDENVFVIKLDPEDDVPLQLLQKNNLYKNIFRADVIEENTVRATSKSAKTNKDLAKIPIAQDRRMSKLPQSNRKENSLKLINNSNICLFESLKTRFRCFFCKNSYFTIAELREHTKIHTDERFVKMCINRLQGMSFKCVDISNLTCRICSQALKDLTELKQHLTETHEITFNGDENMLIEYRLQHGFDCVICQEKFNTFFKLSVHMNCHYTNHVCEICGASYINRLSLRMHVNSRHKEKKCSLCPLTFTNAYLRIKHMRKQHNTSESKRYCLLCNKTFRYTYLLEEHKIQEHGKKRTLSVCPECGKSFLSPVNLRTHIRCVHIKERNHPCSSCGMCFFTSCDRRRHERTHQELRCFACGYCDGQFKSKDSLRRHLKRQHGHLHLSSIDK